MGSRRRGESRICPNPGMFKNVRVSLFPRNFWSELVRYCDSELSRTQSLLAYKLLLLNCWTFSSEQRLVEDISFSIVSFLNLIANSKKTSYTMHFVRSVSASLSLPLHESQFYSQIYKVKFRQMKVRNINNEKASIHSNSSLLASYANFLWTSFSRFPQTQLYGTWKFSCFFYILRFFVVWTASPLRILNV